MYKSTRGEYADTFGIAHQVADKLVVDDYAQLKDRTAIRILLDKFLALMDGLGLDIRCFLS